MTTSREAGRLGYTREGSGVAKPPSPVKGRIECPVDFLVLQTSERRPPLISTARNVRSRVVHLPIPLVGKWLRPWVITIPPEDRRVTLSVSVIRPHSNEATCATGAHCLNLTAVSRTRTRETTTGVVLRDVEGVHSTARKGSLPVQTQGPPTATGCLTVVLLCKEAWRAGALRLTRQKARFETTLDVMGGAGPRT